MGTPIRIEDIRKGDKVREITRTVKERTSDYTAGCDRQTLDRYGSGDKSWELLERPRKLKYAKGTELWLTTRYFPWSKDDRIVLREDWYEDEYAGKVVYPGKNYIISKYAVTDVRPRKLIHARGTTLYLKHDHHVAKKGDPVTTLEDFFEGQHSLRAIQSNGYKDGYPYDYWLTTEKPRVLKWARGTTLYIKEGEAPIGEGKAGDPVVLRSDHFEGDEYVDIEYGSSINGGNWYARRFTDEKPEPHPVGAIRWVTEDCESAYGYVFKRGDRVKVTQIRTALNSDRHTLVVRPLTGPEQHGKYIEPRRLSETLVEPEPTIVAVPLPAIEKLRDEHNKALHIVDDRNAQRRNLIRRNALNTFLDTREVKTALREDDLPW